MVKLPFDFTYSSLAFILHRESLPFTLSQVKRLGGGRRDSDDCRIVESDKAGCLHYFVSIERGRNGLPLAESWTEGDDICYRRYSWERTGACTVHEEVSFKTPDCAVAILDHAAPVAPDRPSLPDPSNMDELFSGRFDDLLYSSPVSAQGWRGTFRPAPMHFDSIKLADRARLRILRYAPDGRLESISLPGMGLSFAFTWEGPCLLRCAADGFLARFNYDAQGRLAQDERHVSDSFLASYCHEPGKKGRSRESWSYRYDSSGRLADVIGEEPETRVSLSYGSYGSISGRFYRVSKASARPRIENQRLFAIGPYVGAESLEEQGLQADLRQYPAIRGGLVRDDKHTNNRATETRTLFTGGRGFYRWQLKRDDQGNLSSERVSFVEAPGSEEKELVMACYCQTRRQAPTKAKT